jgi:hypothetical protein
MQALSPCVQALSPGVQAAMQGQGRRLQVSLEAVPRQQKLLQRQGLVQVASPVATCCQRSPQASRGRCSLHLMTQL